jgi:hypothetical protein
MNKPLLVISYGAGVDSTAMLVAMKRRGIRPDLILFADTGGEKPETYAYLPIIDAWLERVGFPVVTTVRYKPVRATYSTLEGQSLKNQGMPALAFGGKTCSILFKVDPQHKFCQQWQPALDAWERGEKVTFLVGYDNGKQDCRRRVNAMASVAKEAQKNTRNSRRYQNAYPLQDWKIDRADCIALIESAGLPVPVKSACFFCPAMTKKEIVQLRDDHPDLYRRALAIESGFLNGKHSVSLGTRSKGLGRRFAWSSLANVDVDELTEEREILRP